LEGPHSATIEIMARLENVSAASDWFPWAEVSVASTQMLAREAGMVVSRCWPEGGRWFAALTAR